MTDRLQISSGSFLFVARLEHDLAPATCAEFVRRLPFRDKLIHARWSGEACWIPMGATDIAVEIENATAHPAPGHVLLYSGGVSETEILVPYGGTQFASIAGPLAGNHFLTVERAVEHLRELGVKCLWEGAQEIAFEALD